MEELPPGALATIVLMVPSTECLAWAGLQRQPEGLGSEVLVALSHPGLLMRLGEMRPAGTTSSTISTQTLQGSNSCNPELQGIFSSVLLENPLLPDAFLEPVFLQRLINVM